MGFFDPPPPLCQEMSGFGATPLNNYVRFPNPPPPHYGPRTNSPQRPRTRWSRRTLEAPHLQPPAFTLPSTWGTRTSRPALRTPALGAPALTCHSMHALLLYSGSQRTTCPGPHNTMSTPKPPVRSYRFKNLLLYSAIVHSWRPIG